MSNAEDKELENEGAIEPPIQEKAPHEVTGEDLDKMEYEAEDYAD